MGIGMALHEDLLYDRAQRPAADCRLLRRIASLTHRDAPEIEVIFIESDDGYGPFGAKSMGESSKVPAVAAVGNAIFNAIGRRMKDLPITRDKILGGAGMKAFTNANAADLRARGDARRSRRAANGQPASFAGGGSDLLGMVKERLVAPDVLVNLKSIKGLDQVTPTRGGVTIGGLITLDALSQHPLIRRDYAVLAEAAESVATPQIRNVGTLAGNVCQRPWCWYFRNGFPCSRTAATPASRSPARTSSTRSSAAARATSCIRPTRRRRWSRSTRRSGSSGRRASGRVPAAEFFVLPTARCRARERARRRRGAGGDRSCRAARPARAARITRCWTAKPGRTRSSARPSCSRWTGDVCRSARVVLGGVAPIPWRLPEVEKLLAGQRITPELAAKAGEAAVAGARPLAKNAYKVPLTRAMVSAHARRHCGSRIAECGLRVRIEGRASRFPVPARRPAGGAVLRAALHAVSRLADGRHDGAAVRESGGRSPARSPRCG